MEKDLIPRRKIVSHLADLGDDGGSQVSSGVSYGPVTRRQFIKGAAVAGAGGLLVACGVPSGESQNSNDSVVSGGDNLNNNGGENINSNASGGEGDFIVERPTFQANQAPEEEPTAIPEVAETEFQNAILARFGHQIDSALRDNDVAPDEAGDLVRGLLDASYGLWGFGLTEENQLVIMNSLDDPRANHVVSPDNVHVRYFPNAEGAEDDSLAAARLCFEVNDGVGDPTYPDGTAICYVGDERPNSVTNQTTVLEDTLFMRPSSGSGARIEKATVTTITGEETVTYAEVGEDGLVRYLDSDNRWVKQINGSEVVVIGGGPSPFYEAHSPEKDGDVVLGKFIVGSETPLPELDSTIVEENNLRLSYEMVEDERVPVYRDADLEVKYRLENGVWVENVLVPEMPFTEFSPKHTETINANYNGVSLEINLITDRSLAAVDSITVKEQFGNMEGDDILSQIILRSLFDRAISKPFGEDEAYNPAVAALVDKNGGNEDAAFREYVTLYAAAQQSGDWSQVETPIKATNWEKHGNGEDLNVRLRKINVVFYNYVIPTDGNFNPPYTINGDQLDRAGDYIYYGLHAENIQQDENGSFHSDELTLLVPISQPVRSQTRDYLASFYLLQTVKQIETPGRGSSSIGHTEPPLLYNYSSALIVND